MMMMNMSVMMSVLYKIWLTSALLRVAINNNIYCHCLVCAKYPAVCLVLCGIIGEIFWTNVGDSLIEMW